jgi:serine/threonine protein kinase
LLRAFAKGQLDAKTEDRIVAILETRPDLVAEVEAISVDPILEKMKAHSKIASEKSLSSQIKAAHAPQKISQPSAQPNLDLAPELTDLPEFKIIREIGRGGMGVVYLAEHRITGRKEVLKVLNERLISNSEARQRFEQEIKCIASMNHETIVRCYTVIQLADAIVLCMEYVPGVNLHQYVSTSGPLPIPVACGIAVEICRGLQHAMDNGLVHRDIKPSNIMLYKANGKVKAKILDFGLARFSRREAGKALTNDGTLLGTLEYIAPEQSLNAAMADIRADIYSLGCTLYHMLVGHPPFSGSTGELIMAHAQSIPPAINLIRPEIPGELADVLAKMLAKHPDQRYGSPNLVGQALIEFTKRSRGKRSDAATGTSPKPKTAIPVAVTPAGVARPVGSTGESNARTRDSGTVDSGAAVPAAFVAAEPLGQSVDANPAQPRPAWDAPAGGNAGPDDDYFANACHPVSLYQPAKPAAPPRWLVPMIGLVLLGLILGVAGVIGIVKMAREGPIRSTETSNAPVAPQLFSDAPESEDAAEQNAAAQTTSSTVTTATGSEKDDWQVLFDGTEQSFYKNWTMHDIKPNCRVVFDDPEEMRITTGPGEGDFVGFITKQQFKPAFHLSIDYKNFNGSPKVLAFGKHRGPDLRGIAYSVTLGGYRKTKPTSPIVAVGNLMAGGVHDSDFDIKADPVSLTPGQPCHMEIICFEGRIVIKVDGKQVNELDRSGKNFENVVLHFWTKRSARIAFSEIKIRAIENESDFASAINMKR